MRSWQIIAEVARREIVVRGRSRGFRVSTLLMAIGLSVLSALPGLLGHDDDTPAQPRSTPVAVVLVGTEDDAVEVMLTTLQERLRQPVQTTAVATVAEAEVLITDDRVRFGFDVTTQPPTLLVRPTSVFTGSDEVAALAADTLARVRTLLAQGLSPAQATAAMRVEPLATTTVGGDADDTTARSGLAYAALMFVYTTMILYGTWVVNGVVEEKSNRIVELLLSTLRPRDLLAGKVLGLGVLGVGQVGVVIGAVLVTSAITGGSVVQPAMIPALVGILGWWILGFAFFAMVMAGFGSLVSRAEEIQAAIGPAMVLVVASVLAGFVALEAPDGTLAAATSFVPFTAPMVMTVRTTLGAVPWWQIVLAVASIAIGVVAMAALAGRIYAGAVMRTHGKVKLREAWRGQAV